MNALLRDLRHGVRLLVRAPGFTLLAAGALAIGIGASTAVFSVIDAVLLKPLPYSDPDRLALVWERNLPRNRVTNPVSPANFMHWRDLNHSFADLAAVTPAVNFTLTGAGEPIEVPGQLVTGQFFPISGIQPVIGRLLMPEDDVPRARVAVISDRLWARQWNRNPAVLTRPITFDGESYTVVGVVPASFSYLERAVEMWTPLGLTEASRTPRGRSLSVIGRLKPGVSIAEAQQDLAAVHAELTRRFPAFNTGWTTNVVPLKEQVTADVKPALLVLLAAVALVLLTACANVANLLLARATARQRELAVRAALGAGRARIARQLLAESAVLGLLGGAVGLLLGWWALLVLRTVVAQRLAIPRLDTAGIDGGVLAFTMGVSIVSALLFGVLPALGGTGDLTSSLKEGGRTGSGARGARARAALVVGEVVLALILLVGAGLLLRSFARLLAVDPGFDPGHTLTLRISLPDARYDAAHRAEFFHRLFERLDGTPGVTSSGAVSFLPLTGLASATSLQVLDRPKPPVGQEPVADVRIITHDFLRAMGAPLVEGRLFRDDDPADARGRVVVNRAFARQHWPEGSAIGQRIRVSWTPAQDDEIIGVVGDMRHAGLDTEPRATVYFPYPRTAYSAMTIAVRSTADSAAMARTIVGLIRRDDAQLAVTDVRTMDEVIAASVIQRRLLMLLVALFAGAALVLVAVGIYGVIACSVSERTREIGIRMALGAQRGGVLRMVIGQAIALAAVGVLVGAAGAAGLTRLLSGFLFEVSPVDPLTFAAVSAIVVFVALLASTVPALRATRVDPIVALRGE